tara:strand:- start:2623 stop:4119 length:1497 start_codon:yes stop_codon:yes gene_type:complete
MKLIRLTTTNTECIFDNQFNDEILVKPNSTIALQNISVETVNNVITIDSDNNEIDFTVTGNNFAKKAILDFGTYTEDNHQLLLNDIQNKLNSQMVYNNVNPERRILGIEWKVDVLPQKARLYIEYKHSTFDEQEGNWNLSGGVERRTLLTKKCYACFNNPPRESDNLLEFCKLPMFVARGNGGVKARVHKRSVNVGIGIDFQNFLVGLTSIDLSSPTAPEITRSNLNYSMGFGVLSNGTDPTTGTNTFYWSQEANGFTEITNIQDNYAGEGSSDNDTLEMKINGGFVEALVWRNGSVAPLLINRWAYNEGQKLYPCIFFNQGSDKSIANNLRVNPSPFDPHIANSDLIYNELELGAPPIPQRNSGENFLQFQSQNLATFLGFRRLRYPQTGFIFKVTTDYIAEDRFSPQDVSDAFIIELMNLQCESYDGLKNQRKNILYIVPQSDSTGQIIYEPPNLLPIDLNNNKELSLRNIRIRCVRNDYTPLQIRGLATLTLILN